MLVACVSPSEIHVDESLNTLRYAQRSCSSCASDVTESDNKLAHYMNMIKENKALKSKIINLRNRRVSGAKEQHDIRPPLQRGNSTSSVMTITTSTNNNNNNSSHANSSPDFASIRAKLRDRKSVV